MSVCPPADRSAQEHGPVRGLRWRTPVRRCSMSSKRSDNCGRNSSHHDCGRGRSVLRSSLRTHTCPGRHEPVQRRGRTCVRESYPMDCGVGEPPTGSQDERDRPEQSIRSARSRVAVIQGHKRRRQLASVQEEDLTRLIDQPDSPYDRRRTAVASGHHAQSMAALFRLNRI
jgi:hypothetical protein